MLQLGGTTASFPALKANGTTLEAKLADDSAYALVSMSSANVATTILNAATGHIITSMSAPTMGACGTTPSVVASNGTSAFRIQVGNPAATTCVVNLPTASTGWVLQCGDMNAPTTTTGDFAYRQTATTTTTATLSFYNNAATLTAPAANANFLCSAFAY